MDIRQLNYDNEYKEALDFIRKVQSFPLNYEIEYERGKAYKGLALNEDNKKDKVVSLCEAKSIFEMIIKNCNNLKIVGKSKIELGDLLNRLEKYDEAIEIMNSINNVDTIGVLSYAYKKKGDHNTSINMLQERLLNSMAAILKSCFCLCSIYNETKEFDKAIHFIELFRDTIEVMNKEGSTNIWDTEYDTYYFYQIVTMIKQDKIDEALVAVEDYINYAIYIDSKNIDELNYPWYFDQLEPCRLINNKLISERVLDNFKNAPIYRKLRNNQNFDRLVARLENELAVLKSNDF